MLYTDFTEEILGLQWVKVTKIEKNEKTLTIYAEMERKEHHCISCGKRFFEKNTFLPKYYRMTNRLAFYVLDKLRNEHSFTSVAREVNLSVTTVIRIFDMITYSKPKTLPIALSIDEFKGNT